MASNVRTRTASTSLMLEILLYFGRFYQLFFWCIMLVIQLYKAYNLPYPQRSFNMEIIFWALFIVVEPTRSFMGSKGNKTESLGPFFFYFFLTVPIALFHIYFVYFATYVLKIDQILNGASLGFVGLQTLVSIWTVIQILLRK